jgi:hypothetical protein
MSAKVFISHSSNDHKAAQTICTALEHRGLVCWMASRDVGPGQNYMDAIVHAIRDAKVMVLVFSQNANISSEILKELSLASKYKVNVIPARIEDVVPSEAFELEFATRQWIDLFDWEREIERLSSWIVSIVPLEPKTDAAAKRAATAVHPGSTPTPQSPQAPQAPIIENRAQLVQSDAETPIIQKKEEPLPSHDATKWLYSVVGLLIGGAVALVLDFFDPEIPYYIYSQSGITEWWVLIALAVFGGCVGFLVRTWVVGRISGKSSARSQGHKEAAN